MMIVGTLIIIINALIGNGALFGITVDGTWYNVMHVNPLPYLTCNLTVNNHFQS